MNEKDKKIKVTLNVNIGSSWDENSGEVENAIQSYCEFAEALAKKNDCDCEVNFDIEAF
ncbi:hypothetical protein [Anaerococcus tetradius]|uniref:Uncharacterized protein n=1 Tax=Anaerococcus tetradius TaxID=33036 RepID=A0A133KG89_9FIRM|nr:hypothetical protein [Anaerococcus tetradius]KWZ78581.1 hypothetical protein HMPREF3200_00593 [Anaerococcus tetradius]